MVDSHPNSPTKTSNYYKSKHLSEDSLASLHVQIEHFKSFAGGKVLFSKAEKVGSTLFSLQSPTDFNDDLQV